MNQSLIAKIDALNKRARESFMDQLMLSHNATDDEIDRVEREWIRRDAEIQASGEGYQRGSPERAAAVRRIAGTKLVRRLGLPERILDLFRQAQSKRSEADTARAEAEQAEAAAASLAARLDSLKSDLRRLGSLRAAILSTREELQAELDEQVGNDSWLADRIENFTTVGAGLSSNIVDSYMRRAALERALSDLPAVEEIHNQRIQSVEDEIEELEQELST